MKKIGENIRFYRNLRGLTQTALARKVQVAPAYISQIEANQRVPSLKVTRRIAQVLGIDMSILVREGEARSRDGRLSPSEKLDLLRTLIMAVEGESREEDAGAAEPRVVEGTGFVARELHDEPAFSLMLREFSEPAVFGRESPDSDLECHIVLEGRVAVVGGEPPVELQAGDCRSLSRPGSERLAARPGARVVSAYAPRLDPGLLREAAEAEPEPAAAETVRAGAAGRAR